MRYSPSRSVSISYQPERKKRSSEATSSSHSCLSGCR
ncbi:hypothetical protein EVA_06944 [gut metagenome]|uniref:Uncharacterized protein n=1 Tax=gut metagenome TaxID=749906 RepID=J9GDJ5_9ZZZZ